MLIYTPFNKQIWGMQVSHPLIYRNLFPGTKDKSPQHFNTTDGIMRLNPRFVTQHAEIARKMILLPQHKNRGTALVLKPLKKYHCTDQHTNFIKFSVASEDLGAMTEACNQITFHA
jgi:hypothetical protein